ncbi:MAG: SDR family NAD(P)-dependent oxidoreductase [Acidobacteriia bacterium]|nr:SDR family NAD(P)-dependent oxidoreductase [Terriglobia bacterium]MYG02481.1 SDR family NAD(P)-dependent oxidoreductase [Terriglobia bacterium]MYK08740.1 SDR family NAD(P)-dependent oxidoreductase [Terriglobia bacterium]
MPSSFSKSANHLWRLFGRNPMAERADMSGRYVIVTGASPKSLGYETARILASWGASVVVTSTRNVARMADCLKADLRRIGADEKRVAAHSLDLCDVESVNGFAAWYRKNQGDRLHVLINNAGIHKNILNPRKKPPLSKDGFEIHWRTNYLGAFHLTSRLLPLLKRSGLECGDARVINVSSHLHDRAKNDGLFDASERYHSWDAYGLSKLALIHFSFEIQRRFADRYNLRSAALHPGSVDTNLTRMAIPGGVFHRVGRVLESFVLLPLEHGAQTTVMCASKQRLRGGDYYDRCGIGKPSCESTDEATSKLLWERSDAWVKTLAGSDGNDDEQI